MWGGEAQLAVGAEMIDYELEQDIVRSNNTGPASTGSAQLFIPYNRDVKSAYAELYLPFVGPEQDVPAVRSFAVNLSTRYDDYSDVGDTTNPKIALNWGIVEALMVRANYAEAFVAPALTSRGANEFGLTGESGFSRYLRSRPARRCADGLHGRISVGDRHSGVPTGLDDLLVEQRHGLVPHGRERDPAAADGRELELRVRHHSAGGARAARQLHQVGE